MFGHGLHICLSINVRGHNRYIIRWKRRTCGFMSQGKLCKVFKFYAQDIYSHYDLLMF